MELIECNNEIKQFFFLLYQKKIIQFINLRYFTQAVFVCEHFFFFQKVHAVLIRKPEKMCNIEHKYKCKTIKGNKG